jgi:hypothetical protein
MSATRILVHGVVRGADAARLGVETVPFAGLAALVSCAPEGGGDDAQRALALARRHHEILCAVAERRDVLPVRLGAVFADADALARGLAGKADLFEARLAHCAGAVEFSLVAEELGAPLVACDAAGRRDYLKARAAARARPARVGAALDALEAEVVADARPVERRAAPAPRLRDLALLVQRGATQAVLNKVSRRQADLAPMDLALALHGPWPVYSFANFSTASLS